MQMQRHYTIHRRHVPVAAKPLPHRPHFTLHTPHFTLHTSLSLSLSLYEQGVLSDLGHFRSPPLRRLSARPTPPYYIYSPTKLVRSVPSKENFGSMLRIIFSIPMPKNFFQGAAKFPSGRKKISFREKIYFLQGENFSASGRKFFCDREKISRRQRRRKFSVL